LPRKYDVAISRPFPSFRPPERALAGLGVVLGGTFAVPGKFCRIKLSLTVPGEESQGGLQAVFPKGVFQDRGWDLGSEVSILYWEKTAFHWAKSVSLALLLMAFLRSFPLAFR